MRAVLLTGILGLAAISDSAIAQSGQHLNPMIALHEKGLPVFGMTHPNLPGGGGGRGGGGRGGAGGGAAAGGAVTAAGAPAAAAPLDFTEAAKATVDYKFADFQFVIRPTGTLLDYMKAITAAGGSVRTHAFMEKIPIWHRDPVAAATAAAHQLNQGQVGVMMQEVTTSAEVDSAVQALRFKSAGGLRPDSGYDGAAAYWGLSPAEYKKKADVWPANPNGEILIWAIVESKAGLEHVREIAANKNVTVVWAGYGTLGGVFAGDPAGREAAAAQILAACKEFKKPCGFPTNNTDDLTARMKEGWSVFVMQNRNDAGMAGIAAGRKMGGRG